MAHNWKKKKSTSRQQLEALALKEAKQSLLIAIEWIDNNDVTWAEVKIASALRLIEVVKLG